MMVSQISPFVKYVVAGRLGLHLAASQNIHQYHNVQTITEGPRACALDVVLVSTDEAKGIIQMGRSRLHLCAL
jgi:glyceraldehyde-3-phosphate dehydrogenase/erythrose-4-phosphate dehydrogenase